MLQMNVFTVNGNGTDGPHRAQVFAGAAADADFFGHNGHAVPAFGSLTIRTAPTGQAWAHFPQWDAPLADRQASRFMEAVPTWYCVFSSRPIFAMAPAGQSSLQRVHSGRQKPFSKDISGCIRRSGSEEGRSTLLGHSATQSWQPVQCW